MWLLEEAGSWFLEKGPSSQLTAVSIKNTSECHLCHSVFQNTLLQVVPVEQKLIPTISSPYFTSVWCQSQQKCATLCDAVCSVWLFMMLHPEIIIILRQATLLPLFVESTNTVWLVQEAGKSILGRAWNWWSQTVSPLLVAGNDFYSGNKNRTRHKRQPGLVFPLQVSYCLKLHHNYCLNSWIYEFKFEPRWGQTSCSTYSHLLLVCNKNLLRSNLWLASALFPCFLPNLPPFMSRDLL